MSARRKAAALGAIGAASLMIGALTPGTASAHGTISTPISRVYACYGEGPESPDSQVCKDLVADSTTQPLYDWNGVNQANANGQSQTIIPNGKLCSANRDEFRDLDWARTDWPATTVAAGSTTINFRVTAPHKGTMTYYITKQGYSATTALKWSDLDLANPIASYTTVATAASGYYTFNATLPARTGRQLIYMVWQRSDSPEAFYACSDVVYGSSAAAASAAAPQAPTEAQIAADASKSTVGHAGHATAISTDITASAAGTNSAGATLETALSGSALVATGALGLLFWSRRKAAARAGS